MRNSDSWGLVPETPEEALEVGGEWVNEYWIVWETEPGWTKMKWRHDTPSPFKIDPDTAWALVGVK